MMSYVVCMMIILTVPKVAHKTSGEPAFGFYAPRLWNTLPSYIRYASYVVMHLVNVEHFYLFLLSFYFLFFFAFLLDLLF